MPLYKFKVSDPSGKVSELLIEGDSQADATRRVQRRGLMPLGFLGEGAAASARKGIFAPGLDVVDFTDRLVPLLEPGLPRLPLRVCGDPDGTEAFFGRDLPETGYVPVQESGF
jgi:type II secretory pathway component PulF